MAAAHDVTIARDSSGDGEPLVLIHGLTENRRSWEPLMATLTQRYSVVRVDLPGHGESSKIRSYDPFTLAAAVNSVVVELGLEWPIMCGHSLGGIVASAYAGSYPCRGAVNLDQALALAGFKEILTGLEPMLRADTATFEEAMHQVFDLMAGDRLSASERARIDGERRLDQDVVLGVWGVVFDSTVEELDAVVKTLAGSIRVPYLAIHGIDPGPGYTEWLASLVPSATVEIWAEDGHYPHFVEPDRFLARLAEFTDGL